MGNMRDANAILSKRKMGLYTGMVSTMVIAPGSLTMFLISWVNGICRLRL